MAPITTSICVYREITEHLLSLSKHSVTITSLKKALVQALTTSICGYRERIEHLLLSTHSVSITSLVENIDNKNVNMYPLRDKRTSTSVIHTFCKNNVSRDTPLFGHCFGYHLGIRMSIERQRGVTENVIPHTFRKIL